MFGRRASYRFQCLRTYASHVGQNVKHLPADEARVFINGDAMPTNLTIQWLKTLCSHYRQVSIWKAIGTSIDPTKAAKKFEGLPGLAAENVYIRRAHTGSQNAADALLTALYGRHASSEASNYVLSSDKNWFGELPHIFSDVPTFWRTFAELDPSEFTRRHDWAAILDAEEFFLASSLDDWIFATRRHDWVPGQYVVVSEVLLQESPFLSSKKFRTLDAGTQIDVVEVVNVPNDHRIRGRISKPAGWLSLQKLSTKKHFTWVVPAEVEHVRNTLLFHPFSREGIAAPRR
ncbi:unnamed protein product [Polarella glacialis]|uniref:Uncharacterized protein n=1 Tax=Polarella glacialis TaxID=89957 RepID=A0A813J7J9_POLGL|nr:unnamed protein product [Polarella glacialis]CAE8665289.1 unnamed protein product [Polarella glacialis]